MNQPFCPIYKEARDFLSQSKQPDGNSGLRFDKFGDAWNKHQNRDTVINTSTNKCTPAHMGAQFQPL